MIEENVLVSLTSHQKFIQTLQQIEINLISLQQSLAINLTKEKNLLQKSPQDNEMSSRISDLEEEIAKLNTAITSISNFYTKISETAFESMLVKISQQILTESDDITITQFSYKIEKSLNLLQNVVCEDLKDLLNFLNSLNRNLNSENPIEISINQVIRRFKHHIVLAALEKLSANVIEQKTASNTLTHLKIRLTEAIRTYCFNNCETISSEKLIDVATNCRLFNDDESPLITEYTYGLLLKIYNNVIDENIHSILEEIVGNFVPEDSIEIMEIETPKYYTSPKRTSELSNEKLRLPKKRKLDFFNQPGSPVGLSLDDLANRAADPINLEKNPNSSEPDSDEKDGVRPPSPAV